MWKNIIKGLTFCYYNFKQGIIDAKVDAEFDF